MPADTLQGAEFLLKSLGHRPSKPRCQLYEIHLALKAFREDLYGKYELEAGAVQSLRTHYRKQRGGKPRAHIGCVGCLKRG